MSKFIKNIIANPLFSGSAVLIIGSNIANLFNYIYHVIMGRLLGPISYGELVSLLSLIGLVSIIPTSFNLVIVKYVSSSPSRQEITDLISWFSKKVLLTSIALCLFLLILSPVVASFLNLNNYLLVTLVAITVLFTLPAMFNRSVLQGLLRFKQMVISILTENLTRLVFGILLVYLGFSVGGAISALVAAGFVGWMLSRNAISDYFKKDIKGSLPLKSFFSYSISVVIQSFAMISLYSTDLILVKHFFSSYDAGIYASLSTLGKIIFFGTGPIGAVMFPLVSRKQTIGKNYHKIFNISLSLTLGLSLTILVVYWLAPQLVIMILYGPQYQGGANLLVWFGIFMTIYTLDALFITFNLSMERTKVVILPLLAAIIQVLSIWFYHPNLMSVILISAMVSSLLLVLLLIYSSYEKSFSTNEQVLSFGK